MTEYSYCYESVNTSCQKILYSSTVQTPLYIFIAATIFVTVCGNLLVIISITHFKQLKTPTNYFILSLSVADLLLGGVIMPPSMVYTVETCWYFGDLFCTIHSSIDAMLCNVSLLNISLISVDRYYAICQPLHYQTKITSGATMIMILFSWSVPAFVWFGIVIAQENNLIENFYNTQADCIGRCFLHKMNSLNAICSCLFMYIPGIIIVAVYHKILRIALKQAYSIHGMASDMDSMRKLEIKVTKTFAIIIGVFLSTWTPVLIYPFIYHLMENFTAHKMVVVFTWACYLNSTLNPIVYAFFYSWFRKASQMIMFGKIFKANSSRTKLYTN